MRAKCRLLVLLIQPSKFDGIFSDHARFTNGFSDRRDGAAKTASVEFRPTFCAIASRSFTMPAEDSAFCQGFCENW